MTVKWSSKPPQVIRFISGVRRLLGAVDRAIDLLRIGGPEALYRRLRHGGVRFRGDYAAWINRYDCLNEKDRRAIIDNIAAFIDPPFISLWMAPGGHTEASLRRTVGSLRAQLYPHWELQILRAEGARRLNVDFCSRRESGDDRIRCIDPSELPSEPRPARAHQYPADTYFAAIEPGDILSPHALYLIAQSVERDHGLDIVYTDEDRIDENGDRSDPWFKTDWNFDLMLSQDCLGSAFFIRDSLARRIGWEPMAHGDSVQRYAALLHAAALTPRSRIHHVPVVALHRQGGAAASIPLATPHEPLYQRIAATRRLLQGQKAAASVSVDEVHGYQRVTWAVPAPMPKVSIVIPTKDSAALLKVAVDSILCRTTYNNYEIVVVDNESVEDETHDLFRLLSADPRIRILPFHSEYNFAALNNFAVSRCNSAVVALVNNDVEVISPDWLTEMVGHALRRNVGAVGAKLLYYDDTVQHGGVIVGAGGLAGHAHVGLTRGDRGYFGRAVCTQEVSAVTAACIVLRRSVYAEAGGLDEGAFAIAYNDVDLCLRLRRLGYSIIWTPFAELYHRESTSLGAPLTAKRRKRFLQEAAALRARWDTDAMQDPFYNSNLSLRPADFSLAAPRTAKPWKAVWTRAARMPYPEASESRDLPEE